MRIPAARVMRNVCMAGILEPIPDKPGCTTRKADLRPTARLEHFLIAGVNIGWDFYLLATRIEHNDFRQPGVIFDIALNAQEHSFRNRTGNKINFGIIELLVPIITAQLVFDCQGDAALAHTTSVLQRTTPADVEWHYRFRRLAKARASTPDTVHALSVSNVFDYFVEAPKVRENDIIFHRQILEGLPLLRTAYRELSHPIASRGLLDRTVEAYRTIVRDCGNISGIAADYICVAMYLVLCDYPDIVIA